MSRENKKDGGLVYYSPNIILFIACFLIDIFLYKRINISSNIDLINYNLVVAGFLFTAIGLIISLFSNSRIQDLLAFGYMKKYFAAIYISLFFSIIALSINFLYLYINTQIIIKNIEVFKVIVVICTVNGMLFFLQAIFFVRRLLKFAYDSIKKNSLK